MRRFLVELQRGTADKQTRIHLMGHSFGTIVVLDSLFPRGREPGPRVELVKTMARKAKVNFEGDLVALLPPDLPKMSGADLEAALVRAKLRAVTDRREKVSADDLRQTFADFLPPSYPLEVELQTLVAIAECTSRELLPESYRQKPRR